MTNLRKNSIRRLVWTLMLAVLIHANILSIQAASSEKHVFGERVKSAATQMEGRIYYLSEDTDALPDFSTLKPLQGAIHTDSLDIEARNFEEGFPGITDRIEWFGLVYTGKFGIKQAGEYVFGLESDDGSRLYIDGKLVIDNDGIHPPKLMEASVALQQGIHTIRVEYFQGPRYEIALQLFITPPGAEQTIFSTKNYPPIYLK